MTTRVYIGNLDSRVAERDIKDEFERFGRLANVWVARRCARMLWYR